MKRRELLVGILAVSGAVAAANIIGVSDATAGAPSSAGGVLDKLNEALPLSEAEAVPVARRRRRVWRRICSRVWRRGRPRLVCSRRRVWI